MKWSECFPGQGAKKRDFCFTLGSKNVFVFSKENVCIDLNAIFTQWKINYLEQTLFVNYSIPILLPL